MLLSNKGSAAEKGILNSQTFHLQLVLLSDENENCSRFPVREDG